MLQILQQDMIKFEVPKHYLPAIMAIIQSGALDLKGDKAILHFDHAGNLKMIEYPNKFIPIKLT